LPKRFATISTSARTGELNHKHKLCAGTFAAKSVGGRLENSWRRPRLQISDRVHIRIPPCVWPWGARVGSTASRSASAPLPRGGVMDTSDEGRWLCGYWRLNKVLPRSSSGRLHGSWSRSRAGAFTRRSVTPDSWLHFCGFHAAARSSLAAPRPTIRMALSGNDR
jgi:hypothetical protein